MKVIDALNKIANGEEIKFKIKGFEGIYFIKNNSLHIEYEDGVVNRADWFHVTAWLNEEIELIKQDILDKQEKEYLGAVIKPFRSRVEYIQKISCSAAEYILISIKNDGNISLPLFDRGTMYKKMTPRKEYSLEELGL